MNPSGEIERFQSTLLRPAKPDDATWAFVVLPIEVSEKLPRRGRTTIVGKMNGHPFKATLEPDGRLGHWLKVGKDLLTITNVKVGDAILLEVAPIGEEPEPEIPEDLLKALEASPEALSVWHATTVIARLDWIHWITTAKQAKTRTKRIHDACEMLASGKRRVCCFDPSGYYSKAFQAPEAAK
jgi:hypothetical protein